MRGLVDRVRILQFMAALGRASQSAARVYFTGGSSAVLLEWRLSTIDIDLEIHPEIDDILRSIPRLKEELQVNVEIASPGHFIPELPAWQERSRFIAREGRVDFFHYDFYAQALAKLERAHARDLADVRAMRDRDLIARPRLLELFAAIEQHLFRFPSIDPPSFRRRVEAFVS